jgi:hypothetical protein
MNKGYLRFTNERNVILQKILYKQNQEITYKTDMAFLDVKGHIISAFSKINDETRFTSKGRMSIHTHAYLIGLTFDEVAKDISAIIKKYSRICNRLTHMGELEAIARLKRKHYHMKPRTFKFNEEQVYDRIRLPFTKIQNQLFSEMDKAYVKSLDANHVVSRLLSFLPEKRKVTQEIKPIRQTYFNEADKVSVGIESYSTDAITDEEWREIVDAYKEEFIPEYRYARDAGGKLYKYDDQYAWEVEQEANSEYLQSYKEGIVDAAKDGEATDLLWVAVMDNKTRPEHYMRDGLTATEIEAKLNDEWSDEETYPDRATVPPSGFNCLTAGHKITTDKGLKNIENMLPGDKVLTHKGNFKEVIHTFQSLAREIITIELLDGTKLEITQEHPILTDNGWVLAKDLKVNDWVIGLNEVDVHGTSNKEHVDILNHEIGKYAKAGHDE